MLWHRKCTTGGAVLPTRGNGLGLVTNQDMVVGQLVDLEAMTLYKICISFNSGKLAYNDIFALLKVKMLTRSQ